MACEFVCAVTMRSSNGSERPEKKTGATLYLCAVWPDFKHQHMYNLDFWQELKALVFNRPRSRQIVVIFFYLPLLITFFTFTYNTRREGGLLFSYIDS